jgi:hypothetical protein
LLGVIDPTTRAAQIARQNFCEASDIVAIMLLIMSMAGITVARFGVPQEKNSVASLKI